MGSSIVRRRSFGLFVCIVLLLMAQLPIFMFDFIPTVKAEEPRPFSNVFLDKQPDWQALWNLFNSHAVWDLEWYNGISWVSIKSDLTIKKLYPKNDTCKITLIFNASQTGNYRLTFAIDVRVKDYVNRTDKYQYELTYDDCSIVFDWSDVIAIFGLQITHGITVIDGNDYFWFRMRRDAVPKGAYIEIDPTVIFTTVSVTSVHTCPLDTHTFVIAYHDETNDDYSFQIYDTNGTQVLAETDVDDTSGGSMSHTSIGVSAFNSTTFVIGWYDRTDYDATFAVYNTTGALLSGPTDVSTEIGTASYSVQVSCFNSTHFVIGWYDSYFLANDATFAVYTSSSVLKAGPTDVDTDVGGSCFSVSVSTFNSTLFVIGWCDSTDGDATFAVYNSAGTQIGATIDADTDVGDSRSVSVSTLNSTYFVIGWFDATDQDATFAIYDSSGNVKTAATDADTTVGTVSYSVQVSALNSTAFVISWYDYVDFDLSFATYLSDGTAVAALTDIESWPTAANVPFKYQSPCSQETANNIKIYNDNWIIAYANTTTQAIWKAFYPNGTAWDGTIPAGGPTAYTADSTFGLSLAWNVLVQFVASIGLAQSISLVCNIIVKMALGMSISQSITTTWNILNGWVASIGLSQSISTAWSVLASLHHGITEWFSDLTQSISASWNLASAWVANVALSQNIGASWSAGAIHGLIAGLSQGITTTWNVAIGWAANAGLSQAISIAWATIIKWNLSLGLTQAVSTSWSAYVMRIIIGFAFQIWGQHPPTGVTVSWNALGLLSHSISITWLVLGHTAYNIAGLFSVAASWIVSVGYGLFVGLSQSVSTSWTVLSQWIATVGLAQSIVSAWNVATYWVANVGLAQSITSTYNIAVKWVANIGLSRSISTVWNVLANSVYTVGLLQSIAASWNVLNSGVAHIGLSQSIVSAYNVLAKWTLSIDLAQTITYGWSTLTNWAGSIEISQSIIAVWTTIVQHGFVIGLTQAVTSTWAVLIGWIASIGLSQSIVSTWNIAASIFHLGSWYADLTQSITTSWTIATRWVSNIGLSQSVTTTWNVLEHWTANIGLSRTITSLWSTAVGFLSTINLTQSLTFTWSVVTAWSANVGLTQAIVAAWSVLNSWAANVGLSQALNFASSLAVELEHMGAWIVSLSQTAIFSWNATVRWIASINLDQGISTAWNVLSQWAGAIGLSQALTSQWNVVIGWAANLNIIQGIAVSWNVLHQTTFNIGLSILTTFSASVTAALNFFNTFIADLAVAIETTWNVVLGQMFITDPTETFVLAIAIVVVACVVTYAVAKTQKEPEKD